MATAEQVSELVDKMGQQRAALVGQVVGLTDEDASRMPVDKTGEEQWTVKEQLAHLCEMELSYTTWVRAALNADNPDVGGLSTSPVAIPIEAANGHGVHELLDIMASERLATLALIEGLGLGDFDRPGTHPMFGTLTVLQWLRSFYRHDRMHFDQIAGRDPEYRPRFTAAEPNQRAARLAKVQHERQERRG